MPQKGGEIPCSIRNRWFEKREEKRKLKKQKKELISGCRDGSVPERIKGGKASANNVSASVDNLHPCKSGATIATRVHHLNNCNATSMMHHCFNPTDRARSAIIARSTSGIASVKLLCAWKKIDSSAEDSNIYSRHTIDRSKQDFQDLGYIFFLGRGVIFFHGFWSRCIRPCFYIRTLLLLLLLLLLCIIRFSYERWKFFSQWDYVKTDCYIYIYFFLDKIILHFFQTFNYDCNHFHSEC